eukprot:g7885.t1
MAHELGLPAAPEPFGQQRVAEPLILDASTFQSLSTKYERDSQARDALYKKGREIDQATTAAMHTMASEGATPASAAAIAQIVEGLRVALDKRDAEGLGHHGGLSGAVERALALMMFDHFLRTGRLLRHAPIARGTRAAAGAGASMDAALAEAEAEAASEAASEAEEAAAAEAFAQAAAVREVSVGGVALATRDEYLAAMMALLRQLGDAYCVQRATVKDVRSIVVCRELVDAVHAELMLFDFRNGPLRRKYDGIKYTQRRIETMLYELSLTELGRDADTRALLDRPRAHASSGRPPRKRMRLQDGEQSEGAADGSGEAAAEAEPPSAEAAVVDVSELQRLRGEMEAFDSVRDDIIKKTRDVLKASKQAIYACHRGDAARASRLLAEAQAGAEALLPAVAREPALRGGSFSNALEEWAEGKLFEHWLRWNARCAGEGEGAGEGAGAGEGEGDVAPALMPLSALPLLSADEYVGGVVDLTGEIGRFAVARATARDAAAVGRCHCVVAAASRRLLAAPLPSKLGKKCGALDANRRKLEALLYDNSIHINPSARGAPGAEAADRGGEDADE